MDNLSRKDMIDHIKDALMSADDYTVQQVYEFLLDTEYE